MAVVKQICHGVTLSDILMYVYPHKENELLIIYTHQCSILMRTDTLPHLIRHNRPVHCLCNKAAIKVKTPLFVLFFCVHFSYTRMT